jgi:hypothetical protein
MKMKLYEVIKEVVKGKGIVYASATVPGNGSSVREGVYKIKYSSGSLNTVPSPELAPDLVFWHHNDCVPSIPINLDWNLYVTG